MDIIDAINEGGRVLVLAHHNADIDAVGASIALREYIGPDADLGVPDTVSKGARDLASKYNFIKNPSLDPYDTLIVVDCPSTEQLGHVNVESFDGRLILIDHHTPGDLMGIADLSLTDSEARSASELVYQLLREHGKVNKEAANALICGTVADTSHLKLAGPEQFKYISDLLDISDKDYSDILSILSTPIDRSERIARLKAASRIKGYVIDDVLVVFSYVGSFEAASARSLLRLGSDIAIVFSRRDDEMRISGRCRRGITDILHLGEDIFSEIEDTLDGSAGGHDAAASGNGKNTDQEEIKSEILRKLEKAIGASAEEL